MEKKPEADRPTFTDRMRRLVETCGQTRYAIWKATGISEPILSRFVSGERSLSESSLDTLAEYLGWEVTTKRRTKKGK
jgi:hypothetical protein